MRKSNELQIGKAGEYLACSDLIRKGFIAFPSEQGLPYDIVIDVGHKLLRCQVKTTQEPRTIPQRKKESKCYIFHVKRHGNRNNVRRYDLKEVDVFALVFLDSRRVGYVKNERMPDTLNVRSPFYRGKYYDEQGVNNYENVMALLKRGMTKTEISKELHLHISAVSRICKTDHKPYLTKAKYVEDYERKPDWFFTI